MSLKWLGAIVAGSLISWSALPSYVQADEVAIVPGSGQHYHSLSEGPPPVRRTMYGGVDLGVPILHNRENSLVRPGVNFHGQGGIDFGYLAAFLHGGFRWVPVDFDKAEGEEFDDYEDLGREPLKNPYFGFGLRLQFPNQSRLLPYASGSFDFNFWHFYEDELVCATGAYNWWCTERDVYYFTPGFSGRLGLAIRAKQTFYLDLGVGMSMSFAGAFFPDETSWLEPYIGITQRL